MALTIEALRKDRRSCHLLSHFGFLVLPQERSENWFTIDGQSAPRIIAQDPLGDCFALIEPHGHIACVFADGNAGIIAFSLAEALTLIVTYPDWEGLIDADLATMRKRLHDMRSNTTEDDFLRYYRAELRNSLGLGDETGVLEKLHRAVTMSDTLIVRSREYPNEIVAGLIR